MKLKKFLPRSLYGRFLLIIITSSLVVQVVSIYVFYYSHLDMISKHMARGIVEEMVFIEKSVNKPGYRKLLQDLSENTGLHFSFESRRRLKKKKIADSSWKKNQIYKYVNPLIDPYNRFKSELESHGFKSYEIFENPEDDDLIIVKVQTRQGILSFDVPIKRIASSSSHVFTFWMILTAFITAYISIIFLKNQIRSIRQLREAAEKFGRGQNVVDFRPSGSEEIRSLGISFIKMKERVLRQIKQRTDMLSGVSHDLRTPLTRMKLQLEMMSQNDDIQDLKSDIQDMERLVEEYLDFARSDDKEGANQVKIHNFLQERIINYYGKMNKMIEAKIELSSNLEIAVKKLALKRALTNLVDNAFNYGNKVQLVAKISHENLIIKIEDDGPGIPTQERNNVLKPFYRLDSSRNLDKKTASGGSGLGLAIAADAITSHGGHIKLYDSPLGGLGVAIYIPI